MEFKRLVRSWSPREYREFYASLNSVSRNRRTDLNAKSLERVLESLMPDITSVLDVGCGDGFLLKEIEKMRPRVRAVGVDVAVRAEQPSRVKVVAGHLERLPFEDASFDVVICSHTLEHILDVARAVSELVRVARKQVIVVTPRQRAYFYTLDEHLNYFWYEEELACLFPMQSYSCEYIGGDWVYIGCVQSALQ